jgi:hypothetical protein
MAFDRKQYIKREDSKSALRTFTFGNDTATVYPDFSFAVIKQMVDSDPTARGAMSHFIDKFMEGDYAILKKEDLSYDRVFELKLDDEYNFRHEVLRGYAIMGKFYKNVFLEIVRAPISGEVKALNILDSNNVDVITKPNGDVLEYKSTIADPLTGSYARWGPEEVVWYKLEDRREGYATSDVKALWENLLAKGYVKRYVAWLWKTGQYRILYNFKSASDSDVESFLAYARRNSDNPDAPLIAKGELEQKVIRDMKETSNIIELLKYYDSQTLVLLRIPPIDAGIPDASGRSNADAQSNSFAAHLSSMKKVFEDMTNYKLFPLMNKGNSMIRFAPNDRFEEKQVIENVALMKGLGMKEEVIREYLQDRGMFFGASALFEDPMELAQKQADIEVGADSQMKANMVSPSRQKSGDMNKEGTGEAASTRPEQVSSR